MLPLVFQPYLRPQIWGGRALGERFGKTLPEQDQMYGESWELSGHAHHPSIVAMGEFQGRTLPDVFANRRADLLGGADRYDQFPLLIKLLDCQRTLSVQVHPDDQTAQQMLGEWNGKTEAWVILEAGPQAVIYAGFKSGVGREELEQRLRDGTVEECLHSFKPKVGDCLFMPAGLVHAVGGGVVMAEVQQASDATFRLYDWNRIDPATGEPRKLHIDEALRAIHFDLAPGRPTTPTRLESQAPGVRSERLAECPYFRLDRIRLSEGASCPIAHGESSIFMIIGGSADLEGAGYRQAFKKGETLLIPTLSEPLVWGTSSAALLLRIQIPV